MLYQCTGMTYHKYVVIVVLGRWVLAWNDVPDPAILSGADSHGLPRLCPETFRLSHAHKNELEN